MMIIQGQNNAMDMPERSRETNGFQYSPLRTQDEIRLIRILPTTTSIALHCTLDHFDGYTDDATKPEYVALSYCWGDASVRRKMTLNGNSVSITLGLWKALIAIAKHHNTGSRYWIDALCINQDDLQERNEQVRQMWRIYSQAEEVFAWLGTEDGETGTAFEAMREFAGSCRDIDRPVHAPPCSHSDPSGKYRRALNSIRDRTYFSRTWIIQEFVQARRLRFICGSHQVDDDTMFHCQNLWNYQQAWEVLESRRRKVNKPGHDYRVISNLLSLFSTFKNSQCTDPRDKIYAMLGHPIMRALDPNMRFRPDYAESTAMLLFRFAAYCDKLIFRQATPGADLSLKFRLMLEYLICALSDGNRDALLHDLGCLDWKAALASVPQESRGDDEYGSFVMSIHRRVNQRASPNEDAPTGFDVQRRWHDCSSALTRRARMLFRSNDTR